jgi:hypothetical protein
MGTAADSFKIIRLSRTGLVGRVVNSVTLKAPLLGQGKAHFPGNAVAKTGFGRGPAGDCALTGNRAGVQ